jgi:hypothetical protein
MRSTESVNTVDLGSATLAPDVPVVAASDVTWTITHTVGPYGIDDGGALLLVAKQMCDWGESQTTDPTAANYVTATTSGDATLRLTWNRRAFTRPWRQGLTVGVVDGHLAPGDTVTITLGDRSGGGPGLRAQTFVEPGFTLRLMVDPAGAASFEQVADLGVPIIAGPPAALTLIGPSTAVVGEPAWLVVRAADAWGNVTSDYHGTVSFQPGATSSGGVSLPQPYTFRADDNGVHRFEDVRFTRPGVCRITIRDEEAGFEATANPCLVASEPGEQMPLYWGDLHGQSGETVGSGDVTEYWDYLHDVAAVDYGAHCGNDFQITDEFYQQLRSLVQAHHEPGRFVPFLAYEWSANYPAGGDHNVYFLNDEPDASPIHRSSRWLLDGDDDGTVRNPLPRLRATFRGRDDVLILPHIGGRRANLGMLDDVAQSPVIEISSIHGRFFWFARDAIRQGLKVGFIAGSDDHCGRPGVAPPSTHDLIVPGGLSAIYAPELTREALWAALRARHCYGTSGARIIVQIDAGGHPMGSEYESATAPGFSGRVAGTAPIDTIDLRRGLDLVWSYDALSAPPPDWSTSPTRARLRVAWSGATSKNRPKVAHWDGSLSMSEGTIQHVTPYNLSHPEEALHQDSPQAVSWRSHTSGETDGVTLDLDLSPDARLDFTSPIVSFSQSLPGIGEKPFVVTAGGVDLQVELRWVKAEPGPLDVTWDWTDPAPLAGEHPYWLWISQADGAAAWSSPIFVTYHPNS